WARTRPSADRLRPLFAAARSDGGARAAAHPDAAAKARCLDAAWGATSNPSLRLWSRILTPKERGTSDRTPSDYRRLPHERLTDPTTDDTMQRVSKAQGRALRAASYLHRLGPAVPRTASESRQHRFATHPVVFS